MKRILFCISVFLIFFSAGKDLSAAEGKSERNFWRYDFRSARKYAKEEGKLLLLFFTISDSPVPMNKQMILLYRTNRFFLEKSAEDYVLLHIDLPNDPEKLTAGRKRQNSLLRNRFSVKHNLTIRLIRNNKNLMPVQILLFFQQRRQLLAQT